MTNERYAAVLKSYLENTFKPHTTTSSPRMQEWISKGRYIVIAKTDKTRFIVNLTAATLIATYTPCTTRDINIYKTCHRKSKPFILVPCHGSTAYSWRVPITII